MAIFRCKMCGGNLEVLDGTSFGICEFCETKLGGIYGKKTQQ